MDSEGGFRFEARLEDRGEIGRGGMSVVHQVYDPVLKRLTALKVLNTGPGSGHDSERAKARFLDEARIMGQLDHPGIVPVHAYDEGADGREFISMKLVQGQNFLHRLREQGESRLEPSQLAESLQILMKVCDAAGYAHSRGIVHRDLKPSNIMVGAFGEVYVMDWGIALRMDEGGQRPPSTFEQRGVLGTPTFIAPEQIDDPDGVDPRADVYCLGGILYALLTGKAPHQGRTPLLRLMAASHGRIAPPDPATSPPALVRIAMRALSRAPQDRYPSMGALKAELAAFLHGAWNLVVRLYPQDALIVREGEYGDEAFVIQSGRVEVLRESSPAPIRQLGPGDVFGELAILSPRGKRTSTVRALSEVRVMVVSRETLAAGLGLNSWMGVFVQALAARFAELEAQVSG
jgi:serine/threonine protein kinase